MLHIRSLEQLLFIGPLFLASMVSANAQQARYIFDADTATRSGMASSLDIRHVCEDLSCDLISAQGYIPPLCFLVGFSCRQDDKVSGAPFPTVYARGNDFLTETLTDPNRYLLFFLPQKLTAPTRDKDEFENTFSYSAATFEYRFVHVSASPRVPDGRALCRFEKRPWGYSPPTSCTLTRFSTRGTEYILSLGRESLKPTVSFLQNLSTASTTFSFEPRYDLRYSTLRPIFITNLVNELRSGNLNFDSSRVGATVSDEKITIIAGAGPRQSVINSSLLEELDLVLNLEAVSVNNQTMTRYPPPLSYAYKATLNLGGWVNHRNTGNANDWRMPPKEFYGTLSERVVASLLRAFRNACQRGNKLFEESIVPAAYICKEPA